MAGSRFSRFHSCLPHSSIIPLPDAVLQPTTATLAVAVPPPPHDRRCGDTRQRGERIGAAQSAEGSTTVAQIEQGLKGSHSSTAILRSRAISSGGAGKLTTGDLIYRALANPASSPVGMILAIFLLLSALASVIIGAYYQSIEAHERTLLIPCTKEDGARHCAMSPSQAWDITFLCIFGLELVVRIAVSVKPWTQVSIWIETLCCLPLVMRLVLASRLAPGARGRLAGVAILVQALAPLHQDRALLLRAVILKKAIADSSSAL